MAISGRTYKDESIIYHPDNGLQYCSYGQQKLLLNNSISTSMTKKYDPYENAIAERINSILKQEFAIDKQNNSLETKRELIKNMIKIYNEIRSHLSNSILTPNQIHPQNKVTRKAIKK